MVAPAKMEIFKSSQCFKIIDGKPQFSHSRVFFKHGGITFFATTQLRKVDADCPPDALEDVTHVPRESYCPRAPEGCTVIAPGPRVDAEDLFVKRTDPSSFVGEGSDLAARRVLNDLEACEAIRRRGPGHPNVAAYHGCLVSPADGLVDGLCFTRYPTTLLAMLNPGALGKRAFVSSPGLARARAEAAGRCLDGIREGLRHLHSLGIIHNDLNPANVAVAADGGAPVLIDFDSCSAPGAPLEDTKRTYGWFDPEVMIAAERSDLDALDELRVWLTSSTPDDFRFPS